MDVHDTIISHYIQCRLLENTSEQNRCEPSTNGKYLKRLQGYTNFTAVEEVRFLYVGQLDNCGALNLIWLQFYTKFYTISNHIIEGLNCHVTLSELQ